MRFGSVGVFLLVAGVLFGYVAAMIGANANEALAAAMQQNAFGVVMGFDPAVEQARRANQVYMVLSYASLFCLIFGAAGSCTGLLGALFGSARTSAPSKPASPKPLETKPLETKPLETKPLETKPLETKPQFPSSAGFREFAWGDAPGNKLVAAEPTDRDRAAIKRFGLAEDGMRLRKYQKPADNLEVWRVHVKELTYWFEDDSLRLVIGYLDASQHLPMLQSLKSFVGQGDAWGDGKARLWVSDNGSSNIVLMPATPPALFVFDSQRYPTAGVGLAYAAWQGLKFFALAIMLILIAFVLCLVLSFAI